MRVENVKITNVSLTMEDHGWLTFRIDVKGNGFGCGIGGYAIGSGHLGSNTFVGDRRGTEAIMRIMDVVGVERWEDLIGKYCRVKFEIPGPIKIIGNIIEERWVDLEEVFSEGGDVGRFITVTKKHFGDEETGERGDLYVGSGESKSKDA